MTPIGHSAVGFISGSKIKSLSILFLILGSVFPDFDFVFYFMDDFNVLHRTFSHSVLFLTLVSVGIFIFSKGVNKNVNALSFFIGAMLHLLIDSVLDTNPSNGLGIMILWPLSKEYFYLLSPFGIEINNGSWNDGMSFFKNNFLYILMIEFPFWLYALVLYKKRSNG